MHSFSVLIHFVLVFFGYRILVKSCSKNVNPNPNLLYRIDLSSEFHQNYMLTFCAYILVTKITNLKRNKRKLCKALLYEKCVPKMIIILTQGPLLGRFSLIGQNFRSDLSLKLNEGSLSFVILASTSLQHN